MVQRVDTLEQNLHDTTDQLYEQATVAVNAGFDRAEAITEAAFDAASEATREWFDSRIAGLRASAQWVRETAAWAQDRLDEFVEWCGEIWDAFCEVLADCWTAVRSAFVSFWNSPWRDVLFAVALTVLAVVVTVATAGAGAPLLVAALAAGAAAGTAAAATYGAGEFAARRANVSLIQEGEQTWQGRSMPMVGPDGQPMLDEDGQPRTQPDPTDPANDWYVDTLGSIRRDNDGMLTYVDENGATQRVDPSQPGARELLAREGIRRDAEGNIQGESLAESGRGAGTLAAQKGAEHFVSGFAVGLTAGTGGGVLANMGTTGRIFTQGAISYASSTAVDPVSSIIEQQINTDRTIGESAGEWAETRTHEREAQYARDDQGNEIVDADGNRQLTGYGRGREMSAGEIVTQEAVAFAGNVATAGLAHGGNVWLQNRGVPMNILDRTMRQSLTARGVDLASGVAGEAVTLSGNILTGREQGVNSWDDFQQRLVMAGVSSTASSIASDHAQIRGREMAINSRLSSDPEAAATFNNLSRRDRSHVAEILDGGVGPMRREGGGGSGDARTDRVRSILNDPEVLASYNRMPEQQRLAYSRSLEAAENSPEFRQASAGRTPEEQAALGDLVAQGGDPAALRGVLGDPEALDTFLSLSPDMRQQYAQRMSTAEGAETRSSLGRAFQDEDLVQRFMADPESVPADQRPRAEALLRQRQELEAQTRVGASGTAAEEGATQHRAAGNSEDVNRRAQQARRNMSAEDATSFDALVEAAPTGAHRAMLERAAAAGNDVDTIRQMASHMRAMSDADVLANFTGQGVFQDFLESCVPTSYQIARAERDPVYAYRLQTDPVFRAQEQQTALQQMGGRTVGRGAPGDDSFDNPRIQQALEDNPELAAFYRDQSNFSDEGTSGVEVPLVRDTDVHRNLEDATGRQYEVHTREGMNWRHGTGDAQFADGAPPYHRIDAALDAGLPVPFSAHGHESVIIGSFMRDGQRHYIIHDPMSGGTSAIPRALMDQVVYLRPSSVSVPRLTVREMASLNYARGALGERMRRLFGGSARGGDNDSSSGTTRRPRPGDQSDAETETGGRSAPRVRMGDEDIELDQRGGVWRRGDGSTLSSDEVVGLLGRYTRVGDGRWRRPDGTFAGEHEMIQLNRRRGATEVDESNMQNRRRADNATDADDGSPTRRTQDELTDEIVATYGRNMGESELRQAYMAEVRTLEGELANLRASGLPPREIARRLFQERRDIGARYKDATPEALRHYIYEVNQGRYGDPLGPPFRLLEQKYNGDYDLIASRAAAPNENVDGLLQNFGVWLRQQPVEYLETQQQTLGNPRRMPSHGPDEDSTLTGGGGRRPTVDEIAEGNQQQRRRQSETEGEELDNSNTQRRPVTDVDTEEGAVGNPQRMGLDEFVASPAAQQRLLRQAQEALDDIGGRIRGMDLGEGTELLMGLKRSNLDEFVASVREKVERKGYTEVGQMGDMIRGRISVDDGATVDSVVAQLRQQFPEAVFDIKTDTPYPRVHVDLEGANGIKFELQVGTKATNDFLESRGVRIPDVLQARVGLETADFHVAKYDLLDKITGPRRAQYGLDELDADYNNILRSTGTGRLDPAQQAEITARVQRVLDQLAAQDPDYLLSLYTKGSHGEVPARADTDGGEQTQAGGGRRPTIEEIAQENDPANPLNRPLAEVQGDRDAEMRLFRMADEALAELNGRIHGVDLPEGAVVLASKKRSTVEDFMASVREKVERKGYANVGDMGDMIRGRISLDTGDDVRLVLDKLRAQFPEGHFDVKEDIPYPRIHADLEASNGMKFELQIGTKATNDFLETPGVRIPEVLRGKVGLEMADFHVAKYDLLDKITGPRRAQLGLDEIDSDYNAILRSTGTGELDPQQQAEITARVQRVLDQLAAEDPDYLLSLYTKGSHAPAEADVDPANNTQAGAGRKPIEEIAAEAENQAGSNPLRRTLPELLDDPAAQTRLMALADEALNEVAGKIHGMDLPEAAEVLASKKRNSLPEFISSVREKVTRKEYGVVGEMGDMVRARISVDDDVQMQHTLAELRRAFPDAEFDLKEDLAYPRVHIDITASNGMRFELQLGTKASNEFFENRGIRIPTVLQDKVGAELHDLHIAKYDLLDKIKGPRRQQLGLDELDARHDDMAIRTGRGELDPAEQQRLYDDFSNVLARLAQEDPDYLRSLFTKGDDKAAEGADATQTGGTRKPIEEIAADNQDAPQNDAANPLRRNLKELLDDPGSQSRLFAMAREALESTTSRIRGLNLPEGTEVAAMLKRDTPDEFIASVKEKVERKGYAEIGEMGDMIRGRISVEDGEGVQSVLAQLRDAFPDAVFDLKEDTPYPRIHIDLKSKNGVLFELQLGTKVTNEFFETNGIRIPDALRDKVGPEFVNLHTAKYDLLDKVQGPRRAQYGLDELSARHDEISVATGRGDLDPAQQQRLYDDLSAALQRIADAEPEYINSLYTKDKKGGDEKPAGADSTQAGGALNRDTDSDAESSGGGGGVRRESEEERIARESASLRGEHGSDDTNVAARLMAAAAARNIRMSSRPIGKSSIKLTFGTQGEGNEVDELFIAGGEDLEVFLRTEGPWYPVSDGTNIIGIRCESGECSLIGEQVLNPKYAEYMEPEAAARFLRGLARLNEQRQAQPAQAM